ncbi:hypothetical protein [Pseudonocardia nigra]|uniref:hypothetical protein n=1 Tax=Pseudonocardia nigra TaxID=1921578 RepID=UPI001C5D3557|nr:hypothetical protein [Pseudonocardia nigra]
MTASDRPQRPAPGAPLDPPPPAREQLPLPRRRQQAHLEPQLRTPGGAGSGTPFAAFAADEPASPQPRSAATERAAAFRAATRRGQAARGPERPPR